MPIKEFSDEFKYEAVKRITEQGHPVSGVAAQLGVSANSLYVWLKRHQKSPYQRNHDDAMESEIKWLRQELKRVTDERDILKKAAAYFAQTSG
ncbi:Transposase IS3/IS911 family protein [Yersinia mollaretii ATCC 43969]|uniref:Transposase IS3/IS911 family protein n=1 Tax=Yersinia mollaretii (strain ATCC 43969 / DSM 18520 / CIP 103324 / CNY 7263 / WAIP 204) TaxID=349967 RepID=A0ABP2ELB0_YERMW|nr:Transposase IS3/IS911 family protein [Yersinia mollaretii ATCC 43969]PJE88306.1 IS3 family transposase [Yersinia mollaretii]QKJ01973.1 IS3 family transposase [Yersinia mollaretii ATCC 43969]CQD43328.1 transposase for insertion element IS3 [Yersinia mollaretii]CQH06568.1 transposase for insertion element IS3 [Yersinia mollaretii]